MTEYPLSPLVFAAEKRLVRLSGGTPDPQDEKLLQSAVTAQESKAKYESALCGPKTIAYMLKTGLLPSGQAASVKNESDLTHEIANNCGTTEKGTSIDGLRKGLRKLGYESFGLDLNRSDFQKLPLPAILLDGDHYFAILERKGDKIVLFDTLLNAKREVPLPKEDDPTFRATVIAFHLGELQESPLTGGTPPKPEHSITDTKKPTTKKPSGT